MISSKMNKSKIRGWLSKRVLLKSKTEYNVYHFIPVDAKKEIQKTGLEYGLLSHIIKIKKTIFSG